MAESEGAALLGLTWSLHPGSGTNDHVHHVACPKRHPNR